MNRLHHLALPLALTTGIAVALLMVRLDGEVTGFFRVGGEAATSPLLGDGEVKRFTGEDGYDGQFFLTLGLDPLLRHPGSAAALDNPRYRHRRMLYPLLGYLLGGGQPGAVPWAMVLINLLCVAALVLLVAAALADPRAPPRRRKWTPLLAMGVPGIWLSLSLSCADLLGSTLFVACLVALRRDKVALAATALAAACLTRETYLLIWAALGCLYLLRPGKLTVVQRMQILAAGLPAVAWNLWVLAATPGGTSGVQENLGLPLAGVLSKVAALFQQAELKGGFIMEAVLFPLLLAAAVMVAVGGVRTVRALHRGEGADLPLAVAGAVYVLVLLLSKMSILEYRGGYARVFMDLWLLVLLGLADGTPGPHRARYALLLASAGASVGVVAMRIFS